jgi:hypothetical protein
MSTAPDTQPEITMDEATAAAWHALLHEPPPPMITKSIEAFRRDLPEMLKKHRGRWVAYHGDERIGFGRRKADLYDECRRRGLTDDEFVVCGVDETTFDPDFELEFTREI